MPFKIVQTSENNKNRLFTVPSNWEEENILKWPRKHVTRYIENEFSTPEPDWKTMRCAVKRRNIPSYQTAEYVLGEMLNHTDTEDETNSKQKIPHKRPLQELNLNILADEIICPAKQTAVLSGPSEVIVETAATSATSAEIDNNVYVHIVEENQNNTNQQFHIVHENQNNTNQQFHIVQENQNNTYQKHQCCANLEQNMAIQNILLSNQTQILEQLNTIKKVENTILQRVALLSVQLEDAVQQINADRDSNVTELIDARNTASNSAFYFKPVNNIQQLNDLEKQLSDSYVKQKFKNTFSVICSGGKGIDCAYALADVLFSREFLCQCTWSGGSRGNDVKIAWKSFKNILSFFWEMIHSWDKTYTMNENATFFKNILKNSKKRKMARNQRASTSRKRVKLSKPLPANDGETTDHDEDSSFNENEQENDEENPDKNNTTDENEQNKEEEEKKDVDNENTIDTIEEEEEKDDDNENTIDNIEKEEKKDVDDKNTTDNIEKEEKKDVDNINTTDNIEEEEIKKGVDNENTIDNIEEEEKEEDDIDETAIKEIEKGQRDVKEKDETPIKKTGNEQNNFDKVTITKDSKEEINSEKKKANTAEEAKRKDESHEPSTSSSSNYKAENSNPKMKIAKLSKMKSNPKMKIAKLTKIKKEKMRIVKK